MVTIAVALALAWALPVSAVEGRTAGPRPLQFYLSPAGDDRWSGRLPAPNRMKSDGPFASLERARDAIRAWRQSGTTFQGAVVSLRGGVYHPHRSFALTAEDGGTAAAPILYRAYRNERVLLSGGRDVVGWKPVTAPAIRARLGPAARAHVLQADLKAQGITDYGTITRRAMGGSLQPMPLELFFQGRPMTLARWPNQGWLKIAGAPAGQNGGRFTYNSDRPRRWAPNDDLWAHGYWTWDWADSYEHVRSLDLEKREVATEPPHGVYGYTPGKRFYFLNVLEEIDEPGEYYLDRRSGALYFWPPAPIAARKATVSMLDAPLVKIQNAAHVHLIGLTLAEARGMGAAISGGEGDLIAGCAFRNLGTVAVRIEGGKQHQVAGCDIRDTGEGGVILEGGDRQTLVPGGHSVVNTSFTRYNRWVRTYCPAVRISGVGNRIAHCRIHNAPHNAILLSGNDHVIEFNEIDDVCRETGDAGAVYMGRDMTMRGSVIRENYFHDLRAGGLPGEPGFTEVMAVYLDDCFCGTTVSGNLFVRAGRAVMIGGGRDNTVENNLFVDCHPAVHVDARGTSWAKFWFDGRDPAIMNGLKAVHFDQPPYSTRYPRLAHLLEDEPAVPKGNRIERNIYFEGRWLELQDHLTPDVAIGNWTEGDPGFIAPGKGDFRLRPDAPALRIGFQPIPVAKIGLYDDAYRRSLPVRESR